MSDSYITIPFDAYGRNKALTAYVLNPVRKPICRIQGITQFQVAPKFNDISEIQFEVQRFVINPSTKEWEENPAYKYLRSFTQLYIPELGNKGYYLINTEPTETVESTRKESKMFTAYSYESILEYESLVLFSINQGTPESAEMGVEGNLDAIGAPIQKIKLYDKNNPEFSLLDLVLKNDYYGWKVGHVDTSIAGLERSFEIDNQNTYSFLRSDVEKAFRCIIDFDTKNKLINAYDVETVGKDTNVYLSIEHFLQQYQIAPYNDTIYTVFNVQGEGDLGIDMVNFGSEKIINIDYPLLLTDENLYEKYKSYEVYRDSLRQKYFALNKEYGDLSIKRDVILDRQPVDEVNNNWASTIYYSLDDLKVTLEAFRQLCNSIELLYKDGPDSDINYEELNLSADAALYYSYRDICIPDIESEIEHRETEGIEDATTVEQEFVWECYGLNDLIAESKKLKEQIRNYEIQGYNGVWEGSKFLDQDEFNAHHERWELLKEKYAECNVLIDKKTAQYEDIEIRLGDIEDELKALGETASLEGYGQFTAQEIAHIKELYRESDYTNQNFALTDYDDAVSTAVLENELLEVAAKELEIESRPQYQWQVTSFDLFAMKEFDALKKQINLGDFVWLGRNSKAKPYWTIDKQKFRVIGLEFSGLKTDTNFTITFSTMIQTDSERNDFEALLDNTIKSSVNSMTVGVTSAARNAAAKVTNSLLKPYIEAVNARIDNLEVQNVTAEDLRATSALIQHLTVFDLMAGTITADQSIILTSREGYGSIILDNAQMKFTDAAGNTRVIIGKATDGGYQVNIYGEADASGKQPLLWGSDGITAPAIGSNLIVNRMMDDRSVTTEKVEWNGISEDVDDDGKPVWNADKVVLDGERLPEQWDNLKKELSSIEIVASEQMFIDDGETVTPSTISLTPVLHIINNYSLVEWYYRINESAQWRPASSLEGVYVNTDHVLILSNNCSGYTATNNGITFKASYVEDGRERFYDIMTVYRLSNSESGGVGMAYSVILSNEAQTVATDADYYPATDDVYECTVRVFKGINELEAANAATVLTNTFSVEASCDIDGVTVDSTTEPGLVTVSLNKDISIPANFLVNLEINIPELQDPIIKQISFSASAAGESPIIVKIDSSAGTMFRGQNNTTILTCTVEQGTEDITSRVTKFTWKKRDQFGEDDPTWTREMTGNTISISSDDVTGRAVFYCEVSFD